jgi:hypothetical protein
VNQPLIDRGVRVGNELLAFVRADETIRCLRDQIVVEPLPIDHGTSLALVYNGKPVRGKILAVGPGVYPKRYNGRKGQRTKSWDSKQFRKCDLQVDDIVDLGGLELDGYLFTRILWGDKDVVVCREEDVALVVEDEA